MKRGRGYIAEHIRADVLAMMAAPTVKGIMAKHGVCCMTVHRMRHRIIQERFVEALKGGSLQETR